MTGIDLTLQFGWFPIALAALLVVSAAAIGVDICLAHRRALHVPRTVVATVSAIVGRSPSVPATADQTPSVTSLPEAA